MSKTKTALMKKDEAQNEPHQQVATRHENPYLQLASEDGSQFGKLLKFVEGKWMIGDDEVPAGTEYIAHLDQLLRGWVKFVDGKATEHIIGKVADGFEPPQREELGDTDPTKWGPDKRDPYSDQRYLPMINRETGDFVTFVTGSDGGRGAIGDLCKIYGNAPRGNILPIVALGTSSYLNKKFNKIIQKPEFKLAGWEESSPPTIPTSENPAAGMGDVIPF